MDAKLKKHEKSLFGTIIAQNTVIIAIAVFLLINYSNLLIGSVDDEHFARYDNICWTFLGVAASFTVLGTIVPKFRGFSAERDDGKKLREILFILLAESIYLIGNGIFIISRYGNSALHNVADGSAFAGSGSFLSQSMIPFIALGAVGLVAGVAYFLQLKKKTVR